MNKKNNNSIIPEDLHGPELHDWLSVSATSTREGEYTRLLTPEELTEKQIQHSTSARKIEDLETELKTIKDGFAGKIKTEKAEFKSFSKIIRRKAIDETGEIFIFRDMENGRVVEYTQFGPIKYHING